MSYYRRCPYCRAYLDPEELCSCGGPVFRRIRDGVPEEISKETFMDILQSIRRNSNGKKQTEIGELGDPGAFHGDC